MKLTPQNLAERAFSSCLTVSAPLPTRGISRIGMIPGILYVIENGTQRTYGINLRDLEGFRGESLKELGFRVGAQVRFHTEGEQHVVMATKI